MFIPREEIIKQSARLENVREDIIHELMKIPGVVAVSDGVKRVGGSLVPEICIKVTVEKKRDLKDVPESERIPPEIKGFKTDVEERPEAHAYEDTNEYRPLVGGSCIGSSKMSGQGTLGCFATVNAGAPANAGAIVMLSNFHVMCSTTQTVQNGARIGQPDHNGCCTCCACSEVGIVIDGEVVDPHLDCAIAKIYVGAAGDPKTVRYLDHAINEIGYIAGAGPIITPVVTPHYSVLPGETVYKRGRTTTFTIGTVSNRGAVPVVTYNKDPLITRVKTDQMEITPTAPFVDFSLPGDSGSAIVNARNEVVGLLFAGNPTTHLAQANHIDYVITRLNIAINNSLTETGLPLASMPVPQAITSISSMHEWMTEAAALLNQTSYGKSITNLILKHQHEINNLIRTNREVQVAWHRYCGPSFINHIARSIRDDHMIPPQVKGNTLENLLLKMTAVLMRNGSESLIHDLEKNYMDLLDVISSGNRFKDWLGKLDRMNRHSSIEFSNIEM